MKELVRKALAFEIELGGPFVVLPPDEPPSEARPPLVYPVQEERVEATGTNQDGEAVAVVSEGIPSAIPSKNDAAPVDGPWQRFHELIPHDSPIRDMTTLEELRRYVASTILTPLDETRTNPVFGVGNPNADLMVIGEAPGAEEDRKGEPFVGRAGQLLDKILAAIGFSREENVFIANILKSRPPNNRDPQPDEIRAHVPILYKQIELIRPKLILCVGRVSATTLLGQDDSLKNLRERFHDFHGVPLAVTYHPAALLRNPNWKYPTWDDVRMVRARYDELTSHVNA